MIEFRPFEIADIHLLDIQPSQIGDRDDLLGDPNRYLLENRWSWSAWEGGRPIAMAGILVAPGGEAMAWALLGRDLRRQMVPVLQYVRRVLAAYVVHTGDPVYTEVDYLVPNGVRWAKLLGFEQITHTHWGYT